MKLIKDDAFDISMGNIVKVFYPTVVRAELVNPAVAIGIYDEISKSGYISENYAGNSNFIKQTIDLALKDYSDKFKLKIVIAGANKSNKCIGEEKRLTNGLSKDTWKEISTIVTSYNFDKNQVEFFNKKTNLVFDMYLDCKNGQISIEEAKDITPYLNKKLNKVKK